MKQRNDPKTRGEVSPTKGARLWLRVAIALMVMGVGGFAYLHFASSQSEPPGRDRTALDTTVADATPQESPRPRRSTRPERAVQPVTAASHSRPVDAASISQPPDPNRVRQWVSSLATLDVKGGSISAQQAATWKQNLQQLIGTGTQAVPAIREFLARNQDIDLSSLPGGKQLGYDTTRQALFGALTQIGGPEAQSLLLDTLNTTADPGELALIAKNLETLAPGQYRDQVLSAARETLQMASSGQLTGQRDLGPLFDLFQRLGDGQSADGLLAAAKNWGYYATQTLARLPDGAGIDDLIKLATDPALGLARTDFAYQALADAAWNQPKAADALVMQAREGHIPPSAWPAIAEALGGIQTYFSDGVIPEGSADGVRKIRWVHLDLGNQNYYAAQSVSMTPEELGMRISILDQLLSLNNDPTVVAQLQGQRKNLQSRFNPTPGRAL
jgi:hypothetical protein